MLFACNARAILSTCIGNRYLQTASRAFFSTKPKIFLNTTFTKPMQTFFECLAIPLRMGNRVVCMNTDGCGVCLFRHKALSVCLHMRHDLVVFCLHMRHDLVVFNRIGVNLHHAIKLITCECQREEEKKVGENRYRRASALVIKD